MNKKLNNIFKGDKVIWMVFFFLFIISIVEVFSASSSLTYKGQSYWGPVIKHFGIFFVGVICTIIVMNIRCQYYKIVTPFLLLISLASLLWVLMPGHAINDGSRWINLGIVQFQPSEIAKGTLILAVAQLLSAMQTEDGADRKAIKYIVGLCSFFILLIGVENLSTAVLLTGVIILMMFIGRVPLSQIGKLLGFFAVTIAIAIGAVLLLASNESEAAVSNNNADKTEIVEQPKKSKSIFHRAATWKKRLFKFTNKEDIPPEKFDLDENMQEGHANIAIASSKAVGRGPGNSVERDFLPQAYSDFIYAIIIEEMGLFGGIFVALLYIILLFRTGKIANRCENSFPALLSMGLALLLVSQALFNMLVAVGLAPITGQPLPLISRGGTSTIINCVYIGAILSVSLWAKKKDENSNQTSMKVAK
jgi:cell division protein FtsW